MPLFLVAAIDPEQLSFILGILVWVPLTVWILSIIQWMIMGEVDSVNGLLGIGMGIALGVLTLRPPTPMLSPWIFGMTWLTVMLYPTIRASLDRRLLVGIDLESLEKTYKALNDKPGNIGLKLKVARLAYSRGLIGQAIALAEESLKGLPPQLFEDEHKMILKWRHGAGNPQHIRSLPCLECGFAVAAGHLHCSKCGAPVLLHHARGQWLGPNLARRLIAGWTSSMAVLIGAPMAATFLPSGWPALSAIGALILVSGFLLWRTFRADRRSQSR